MKLKPSFRLILLIAIMMMMGCSTVNLQEPINTVSPEITVTNQQNSITPTNTNVPNTLTPEAEPTPTFLPYMTPDWFDNAVIYEIFVRSFADSDGDGIGDLIGIAENLDYLESLSVDVIWLMPIYASPSVHGYDVIDFYEVNPDYGTLEDLQALVNSAHERDIKVILDFVPSHLSDENELFAAAYRNPDSDRADWFVWTNEPHTTYAGFAGSNDMPRFNHYNPEVVEYLIEAAKYWLDLDADEDFTDGVDGLRVDNVTFPPREFFYQFRNGIKLSNPETILLGEAWVHKPSDLAQYYENQFDALFDFPMYELLQGSQDANQDGLLAGKGFPVLLTSLIQENNDRYPDEGTSVIFLNNHDTNRIATEVAADPDRLSLVPKLLAAFPGPVMIYYGEEIGMPGQKGGPPYWDNYRREPFDWYEVEDGHYQTSWFQPPDRWNKPEDGISVEEQELDTESLLNVYRQAFRLRTEINALQDGGFEILDMEVSGQGPWGFVRESNQETVYAVYNFGLESQIAIFDISKIDGQIIDLLTGEEYPAPEDHSAFTVDLAPGDAIWLGTP